MKTVCSWNVLRGRGYNQCCMYTQKKMASIQASVCVRVQSKLMSYTEIREEHNSLTLKRGNNSAQIRNAYASSAFFFLIYDSLLDLATLFDFSSCAVQKQWSDLFDLWAMTLIHMIDKCMMRFGCIFCSRKEHCVKDLDCFDERFPHSCTYICRTCRCPEWAQDNATYATSSSWMLKPCLTTS